MISQGALQCYFRWKCNDKIAMILPFPGSIILTDSWKIIASNLTSLKLFLSSLILLYYFYVFYLLLLYKLFAEIQSFMYILRFVHFCTSDYPSNQVKSKYCYWKLTRLLKLITLFRDIQPQINKIKWQQKIKYGCKLLFIGLTKFLLFVRI
jgi:hypothetical protein